MATYSKATTSGNYTIYLVVNNVDQDITNNRSKVQYKAYITGASGTSSWGTGNYTVSINGAQTSGSVQYDFSSSKTWYCVGSASAYVTSGYITHNSDGTKSINVSFSFSGASLVGSASINETFTLNTIPRASDVTVSNYSITNTTSSISATITSKANFYHKWRWKIGSGSWSGWTNKGLISTTSSTVTVANTSLLSGMPTSTSATFTIEVRTYSDSGYATHVGTKTATCTVSVNTSNIKPSVTLGNIAINSSPISGYAVAGYSTIKSSWSASGGYGTTSNTTYFTVSSGSLTSTTSTSASGTVTSNTIPQSASNYTLTIYAYSKDSRGAVSDTVSKSITVYGYQPPTATLSAYRVADSTSTTEDGAGVYVYVTFSGAVRSTVNSQNSIQSTTCTYSGSISGTATNGQHIALADSQSATFTLTVRDKVTSSTATVNVAMAHYPLDLFDNGSGTVGVGVGTTAEFDSFRLGDKIYVTSDLKFEKGNKLMWKESGRGGTWPDAFAISADFTDTADYNKLIIQGAYGEQGTQTNLIDLITIGARTGQFINLKGNIWSGESSLNAEGRIGANSLAGQVYLHSSGNNGTSGLRGVYGINSNSVGQELVTADANNNVRLGFHSTFRCNNTNTDTFTFENLPNLNNGSIFKYAFIYGGFGSTGENPFAYYIFFSTNNVATFTPILFSSQSRTFTATVSGRDLTLKANGTCWGGIRLIWIN